jgi:hypothetical protein
MRTKIVFLLLVVAVYLALVVGIYFAFSSRVTGANDLYPRWRGAYALLVEGRSPYSEAVTQQIQREMYGRLARADEDQVAFAYPLYVAFLIAPLVLIPYAWAQAAWMALLTVSVIGGVALLTRAMGLRPLGLASLVLGVLISYPVVRGIFLGQFALLAFGLVALAMISIQDKRDFVAGALLVLATCKPQDVVLIIPLILLWAARVRRWRIWMGAGVVGFLLFAISFFFEPDWLSQFYRAVALYPSYARIGPPLENLVALFVPDTIVSTVFGLSALVLVVVMLWFWRGDSDKSWQDLRGTFDLTALVTTLVAIRIGSPDQIFLLFAWQSWYQKWWAEGKRLRILVTSVLLLVLPWAVFLITLRGIAEDPRTTIILPLLTLATFVLTRFDRWENTALHS